MIAWYAANEILLQQFLMLTLLGISLQVVMRAGIFSLASIGFWGIGAYGTAIGVKYGWPWPLAAASTVLGVVLLAAVMSRVFRRLNGLYLAMGTLAFDLLVVTVAQQWESVTGGVRGLYGLPREVTVPMMVVLVALAGLAASRFERGVTGRATTSMRVDAAVTKAYVPDAEPLRLLLFVASAVLGALAGSASVLMFFGVEPQSAGFGLILAALTIVVLGGASTWWGCILGALIVALLPEYLRFLAAWRGVVYGLLTVAIVVFAPEGLVGMLRGIVRLFRLRNGGQSGVGGAPDQEKPSHELERPVLSAHVQDEQEKQP